ncbi:glycoside hydrolase family 6 protein [Micromonospora sp. NBC_00898]|uniref:glycoside hydrolase family 6 protein n=1 Tax=Micromonospora sp. NBC_00898 TaxID=2975981 RepID=UPI003863496F|nr:glycoside hydrolase family 6 protein [Micromonospora sp. NBC_00898]
MKGYGNPEWKAKADGEAGGSRVSNNPTAVWLDRIASTARPTAAPTARWASATTLDAALTQGTGYIQFVIYNLSGRDCAALASNGEFGPNELPRYKAAYIDPIAAIQADPKHASLRIVNIIEVDSLHHGWIGWDSNFGPTAYQLLAAAVASRSNIGMLIDTSRNGWGGTARPTGPGATTSADTYVNGGRIDRRIHAGNWCNQAGAGLGERPRANPEPGIDAYVWVKPPGRVGRSTLTQNDEGKGFDRMCDPTYTGNARNGNNPTGALPNAPISGAWFSAQFQELMRNAYPPLS